ncbi:hypothetical protein [Pseudomonas sp.]|uniref:hypothetical protein n=1 Tax=Pseudomonas sp. TaxID=306 RepID=UPI001B1E8A07|nr:hypothetical protein [Pseudomonas sp.]MBO9549511.1 hypothetical protein [Pseudomonas sp.]
MKYKLVLPLILLVATITSGCNSKQATTAASPTTPTAYDTVLGDSRFERIRLDPDLNGYRVESGNLVGPSGVTGAMVVVKGPDNALTAFIDSDAKRGMLQTDAAGKSTFVPDIDLPFLPDDAIAQRQQSGASGGGSTSQAVNYIDALVGFTTKALAAREVDPKAFALGQLEWVNLSLRNSLVTNIELRLAGIRISEDDIPVTTAGLATWQRELNAQRSHYLHDINVGFSVGGDAAGWAYRPGNSSVNSIQGTSPFKHEMGHNVGGGHCYPNAGDNYKHGYNAGGGFTTNLCGNSRPYYSTPEVRVDGKVIGDARTADMARLWREQAGRLSGYSPEFDGVRLIYVSNQPETSAVVASVSGRPRIGVVALSSEVGPTSLTYGGPGMTTLTVKLMGEDEVARSVNLRAMRQMSNCPRTTMNSTVVCHPDADGGPVKLIIGYSVLDNSELPRGWYNGTLTLEARNDTDPNWTAPILVSLAVLR